MVYKLCIFSDIIENVGSNLLVVLFRESSICTVYTYSDFLLVFKLCLSELEMMYLNSDHLRFIHSVDI